MNDILAFTMITAFLVMSPGPNIFLVLNTVSTRVKYAGLFNVSGFVCAVFVQGALSILGLSALLVQSADLFFAVKIIGAMYLLYLGLKMIYQSFNTTKSPGSTTKTVDKVSKNALKSFSEGFLTQILNPKGSMFYLAVFPQFMDFQSNAYLQALPLVSIHASIMILWFGSVCFIAAGFKQLTSGSKVSRWVQRISGWLLITFSALLLQQEAKH